MKTTKKSLNEIDPLVYGAVATIGGFAITGLGAVITKKLVKKYGPYKTAKDLIVSMWNRRKLKSANVTDAEMRALYANGGAAIVDLGTQFSKQVFKKVKSGKITPEQAIDQLDGIIPDSQKAAWLKRFETIYPGASSAAKATYTKVIGSPLAKSEIEKAATKVYGLEGASRANRLYDIYINQLESGKLVVPFKTKSTFPSLEEWTTATGWKPSNPNIGFNEKLEKQQSAYRWHKFIWTLYR